MTTIGWWICSVWLVVSGVWMGLLVAQFLAKAKGLLLVPRPFDNPHGAPTVAVIIPARNEATNIRACVESVLAQDWPHLNIIAIDDRSEDQTAAILTSMAAEDSRLRVIRNTELPPGWMGKSHALWIATREATQEWLLFVDADCRLDPSAVRTSLLAAQEHNADLLSLWPRQAQGGFWEDLLIPLCAGIIALWYGSIDLAKGARGRPFANGQFLLMRRAGYERIGGHNAVRSALIEDVVLAEHAKQAGLSCWSGSGSRLLAVRMYTSLRGIVNGWARIYVGALRSRMKLVLSIVWLMLGSLAPFVVAPWLVARFSSGQPDRLTWALGSMAVNHLLLMFVASWRFWGLGRCRRIYLLLYPVSCIGVIAILTYAFWIQQTGRRISWRNTRYTLNSDAAIQAE